MWYKLFVVILLLSTVYGSTCGGNCPSNSCSTCHCGYSRNTQSAAYWCSQWTGWNQQECQCIISRESGGNANAMNENTWQSQSYRYDVGLWQINSFNWNACSGGAAPCNPWQNLECAKKVYQWGGNSFKYWATCRYCSSRC